MLVDCPREVLFAHPLERFPDVPHGHDESFDRIVHAADNVAELALELRFVGFGVQFSFSRSSSEIGSFVDQAVDGDDALVEVILEIVEVAVVVVGDPFGNVSLGDAVDACCGHAERNDEGVQGFVEA